MLRNSGIVENIPIVLNDFFPPFRSNLSGHDFSWLKI